MSEERYLAGKILKPKGLKGELKILPITDFPESFLERKLFYIGSEGSDAEPFEVLRASLRNGFAYILFRMVDDRDKALALAGKNVYVAEEDLLPLSPDRAYLHELRGLKVFDETGKEAGRVLDVLEMPAHEVYEIECEGKKVLVPAIEEFIEEIDLSRGRMVVRRLDEFA
ncbi:16S rRNA processing protein RimM [Prosthecochloris sp. GSB1]|uniref:ribosome maturation factor RimM n=1 Tax=Prosthecochloris sp. GSB1 TaxID=281093 RepID=UPI000B8CDE34|nr:ribosome maturation factor RimM [Prosthecochloris sp. GSB1]ASQ90583.1 16S rRNA processing protein RimM [Prosthecochloris sp. GSB1]